MRRNLLVGVVLMVAAVVVVYVSAWFDLKLDSAALLGLAVGAVVALVPDGSPVTRLVGFVAGICIAVAGYGVRAQFMPDSPGGRAVTVVIILAVCVALATLTAGRVPLWSVLLGVAGLVGAYEYTYAAAPPEFLSTSVSALTALLMTSAVGFFAAAPFAPGADAPTPAEPRAAVEDDSTPLDDMMEKTK